jgi:hypothetical protein
VIPTPRTATGVLSVFIGRVFRQSPHRRYLIDGWLLIGAVVALRTGRN